jgi:hypothetical protein
MSSYIGQFVHIVGTYDGSRSANGIKIYLNSNRVDDIDSILGAYTAMHGSGASATIGKRLAYSEQYANGSLADIRIYNRALTQAQIAKLSNFYKPLS